MTTKSCARAEKLWLDTDGPICLTPGTAQGKKRQVRSVRQLTEREAAAVAMAQVKQLEPAVQRAHDLDLALAEERSVRRN